MRSFVFSLALLSVAAFTLCFADNAHAACPTDCAAPTGYGSCCGGSWVEYSPNTLTSSDKCCWSFDAGTATTTLSCSWGNQPGWAFNGFSQHISRTLTVTDTGTTHWEVGARVDMIDPHDSWWNQLDARVSVSHPGSGTTTYQLFYQNGTQGDTYCASPYVDVYAQQGDSIRIDFLGSTAWSDSYVRVSDVHVYHLIP
jgi:hypothetical protein